MSYLAAVATGNGRIIDTHFGHADTFLIIRVNEDDGSYEEIEERSVKPACGGSGSGSLCQGSRMNEVAEQLKDVDFVLCAMAGPHAQEVLARYDIAVLTVVMPIPQAVRKLNDFRKKYHRNLALPV